MKRSVSSKTSVVVRAALVALIVPALLAGCAGTPNGFLASTFSKRGSDRYFSTSPVSPTVSKIVANTAPDTRTINAGAHYLRYGNDVVVVRKSGGGSDILVDDYRTGRYSYLGSGFRPGSPAAGDSDGGPGDAK